MNIDLCLVIGIIVVLILLSYLYVKNTKEYFVAGADDDLPGPSTATALTSDNHTHDNGEDENMISRDDIQNVAKEIAYEYCPVNPDYNPNDFVKKSEIDLQKACAPTPDLKDYVLKSTIPPVQRCPSCICPKIKLEAGLCKKCPEVKNNCPKPTPCGVEQCKNVIKCEPWQKQVSCPKCPAPEPCPQLPNKVCPALTIPKSNIKCPDPKPCAMPPPCKDGEGNCPEKKCPKCTYKGLETVVKEKSSEDIINELLESEDPRMRELLEKLKNRLDLNQSSSPTEMDNMRNDLSKLLEVQNNNDPEFEAAPTMASTNLEIEHREMTNNEIYADSLSRNNNETYFNVKHVPKAFDSSCSGDQCPYNTNLPI